MQAPGKGQFQAGIPIAQAAGVNVAANNPVTAALGNAANAVNNVGNLAEQLQKDRQMQRIDEADMTLRRADRQIQQDLIGNANYEDHQRIAQERYDSIKQSLTNNEHYSPRFQREMEQRMDLAIEERLGKVVTQAKVLQVEGAKRVGLELVKEDISSGNTAGGIERLASLRKRGLISKDDEEIGVMGIQRTEADQQLAVDVQQNPLGAAEKLKDPANYPHLNPVARQNAIDQAKQEYRGVVHDSTETFEDGLATGDIGTPEDIDAKYGGKLRPSVVENMKIHLAKRIGSIDEARRNSPEYQAETLGKVLSLMEGLATAEDFDERYETSAFLLNSMKDWPAKQFYKERLSAAKTGREAVVKTRADQGREALKIAAMERGDYGPVKAPVAPNILTKDAVKPGYLKDVPKLQSLGYSKDQANKIRTAAEQDAALGQKKFTELWDQRTQQSVNATAYDIAVADALRSENAEVKWKANLPPEVMAAHEKAVSAYGSAVIEYEKWINLNPDADEKTISAKLRELGSKSARLAPTKGPVKAPPQRLDLPAGSGETSDALLPPKETSMILPKDGVKLSNYGYASDTTPDKKSAKGIGNSNNKLIPGESAAISKSLADRLGLQHGDGAKIETTKGNFTIFYHDTVPVSDSRTGALPETIDIYRPEDGSNSWGGRVTKISKI